ncbi:AM-toxin synthetase [Sphaerulina musiva]
MKAKGRMYLNYLTGDTALLEEQGELHFMGRRDKQVNVRSQRVELADIEHNLVDSVPGITSAAVIIATWNNICKAVQISHTDVSLSNGCSDGDVLTAAWAVAIAFVGRSDNVLFGRVVNGQRALTNNIAHGDHIVGPVMNILPVRVELPLHHNMADLATQDTRSAAYEQPDLDEIATQFVATGLWLEVPNVTDKRRRFTWDSVVAWQDYRRLQAVDDVLPVSDVQTLFDIYFANRICSITSDVPAPDLANVSITRQRIDDACCDTVSLALEYLPESIASGTA